MNTEKIKHILSRYLSGKSSLIERDLVNAWYDQLTFDHKLPEGEEKDLLSSRMLKTLRRLESRNQKIVRLKFFLRAAAVLLMISSLTFLFVRSPESSPYDHTIIVVNNGARDSTLTLTDGSRVLLYPGSMISYKQGYAVTHRHLRLMRGRAFFDVAHRENQPFIVRGLQALEVRVLGTSFDIEQAPGHKYFKVQVNTGKVCVRRANQLLATLRRGGGLKYDGNTNTLLSLNRSQVRNVDINFDAASLKDVVQRLSYIYNVKITLSPKVNVVLRTTARFTSRQPVNEILDLLCSLHHLKLTESADKSTYHISN